MNNHYHTNSRHTYKHLTEGGNILNKSWRDKIWQPHLTFSNTDGNYPLTIDSNGDDSIMIEIIKKGVTFAYLEILLQYLK